MATVEPVIMPPAAGPSPGLERAGTAALRWAGIVLVAVVWLSSGLFGLYILAFYAGAFADGQMAQWNGVLPRLYEPGKPWATASLGVHFAAGGVLLALGSIQLIGAVRRRAPRLHRWIGRVYATSALLAGLGGLVFIAVRGTVGGPAMNLGFGLYGVLMVVAALQTARHAWRRRLELHRAWAIRLFALTVGSWLYRMDYGFWLMLTHGAGHAHDFGGAFDVVMAFFFYLPNLLVAEAFVRARSLRAHPALKLAAALVLVAATGCLLLGTYYFTKFYWGPAVVARLAG